MQKCIFLLVALLLIVSSSLAVADAHESRWHPKPSVTFSGDWIVSGEETWQDTVIILTGNLIVEPGGNLTFINCTLYMNCSSSSSYHIEVKRGGVFNVLDGSLIAAYDPSHRYNFYVHGKLIMRDSEVRDFGRKFFVIGYGLEIDSLEGVIIENCILHNCTNGIVCEDCNNITVKNSIISADMFCVKCVNDVWDVEILNCTIHGGGLFSYGIYIETSSEITVAGCEIYDCLIGMLMSSSVDISISMCKIYDCYTGIACYSSEHIMIMFAITHDNEEEGIYIENSHDMNILSSSSYNNYHGIFLNESSSVIIAACHASNNSGQGIVGHFAQNVTLMGCHMHNNYYDGVLLYNSSIITISQCEMSGNTYGIRLSRSSSVTLSQCKIYGNQLHGLEASSSSTITLSDCEIYGNNSTGVFFQSSSSHITLSQCKVYGNHEGIEISYSLDATLTQCEVYENIDEGICMLCANGCIVSECTIENNQGFGIYCTDSQDIKIENNHFMHDGLVVDAISVTYFSHYIVRGNLVNGKPLYFISGAVDYTVPQDAGEVIIIGSMRIQVKGLDLSYTDIGLQVLYSTLINVSECIFTGNEFAGIRCHDTQSISISYCTIYENYAGVYTVSTYMEIHYCNIYGNQIHGLYTAGTRTVNATCNWWGDPAGPEYKRDGDPDDPEEIFSFSGPLYLLYRPWLTSPVSIGPPKVEILQPANGSYVKGVITVLVNATDDDGIDRVELYINGTLMFTDRSEPYEFHWNTTRVHNGAFEIKAVAYDTRGMSNHSIVIVIVDNLRPMGRIISPRNKALLKGIVNVTVNFADDMAIKEARLYIDNTPVHMWSTAGTYTYTWDTTRCTDGAHLIKLVVVDMAGNIREITIHVTVDNTPPTIESIQQSPEKPSENQQVTVKVKVADATSRVVKVTLYYRVDNGDWITVEMTRSNDTWIATIPGQAASSTIQYYIEAQDMAGNIARSETYSYTVASSYTITQEWPSPLLLIVIAIVATVIIAIVAVVCISRKPKTREQYPHYTHSQA